MPTDSTGIVFPQMKKPPDVLTKYTVTWRFELIISILLYPIRIQRKLLIRIHSDRVSQMIPFNKEPE
jgi:hypothetical protein